MQSGIAQHDSCGGLSQQASQESMGQMEDSSQEANTSSPDSSCPAEGLDGGASSETNTVHLMVFSRFVEVYPEPNNRQAYRCTTCIHCVFGNSCMSRMNALQLCSMLTTHDTLHRLMFGVLPILVHIWHDGSAQVSSGKVASSVNTLACNHECLLMLHGCVHRFPNVQKVACQMQVLARALAAIHDNGYVLEKIVLGSIMVSQDETTWKWAESGLPVLQTNGERLYLEDSE